MQTQKKTQKQTNKQNQKRKRKKRKFIGGLITFFVAALLCYKTKQT